MVGDKPYEMQGIGPAFNNQDEIAISADGSTVVGRIYRDGSTDEAFRWAAASGFQTLGLLPDGEHSCASAVNADGSVVVGRSEDDENNSMPEAFRWTENEGMVGLGFLPDGTWSQADAVSADGTVIAGIANDGQNQTVAFRWTESGGMQTMEHLPGISESRVHTISADGAVIAGICQSQAGAEMPFIWTEQDGMVLLPRVDENIVGGWLDQLVLQAVSDDGALVLALSGTEAGTGLVWERGFGWQTLSQRISDLGMSPSADLSNMRSFSVAGRSISGAVGQNGSDPMVFTLDPLPLPTTSPDTTAPEFRGGNNVVIYDADGDGETLCFSGFVSVVDDTDSNPYVMYTPPTGTTLPPGETLVQVLAIDAAGNMAERSFTVTVQSDPLPNQGEASFTVLGNPGGSGTPCSPAGITTNGGVLAGVVGAALWTEETGWQTIGAFQPTAISENGLTVAGYTGSSSSAVRWTWESGVQDLGSLGGYNGHLMGDADNVSADGAVVVGRSWVQTGAEAFRWTVENGMEGLGFLPGGSYSEARAASADGSVVVGYSTSENSSQSEAFRWSLAGGMEGLGLLPGGTWSRATAVSADGTAVFGMADNAEGQQQAFCWTQANGLTVLAGAENISALTVLANGTAMVGMDDNLNTTVVWTQTDGWRTLSDILLDYGINQSCRDSLGSGCGGYGGTFPAIVSGEDILIAGRGYISGTGWEAWLARIPLPAADGDLTPPEISGCGTVTEISNAEAAAVDYTWMTVTDDTDPNPTVEFNPPAGSRLPVGDTVVSVAAWDAAGNTNTCEFTVTVAAARLEVSRAEANVREGGEGRFFVRLASAPAGSVVVTVARVEGDTNLTVKSGAVRAFKPANWDAWQAVVLAAGTDGNDANETATFRISAPGYEDTLVTAAVLDDDIGENLALPASGNTLTGSKAYQLAQVVDGVHTSNANYGYTIWTSDPPGTMLLDLKRPTQLTQVRLLNWDWTYRVNRYRLEASADGTTWTDLAEDAHETDRQGWDDWAVNGDPVRFVRFTGLSGSANQCVVISELEVYGTPEPLPVLEVSKTAVNVREQGEGRFFVRLAAAPLANVTVTVAHSGGDTNLTVTGGAVRVFKPSNWDVWQAVVLAAGTDANADSETATFQVSASGYADTVVTATALDGELGENLARAAGTTVKGWRAMQVANAVDGVHTASANYGYTIWTNDPPGMLTVDLKSLKNLVRVRLLTWDWTYRVNRYRLEASADGVNWTDLAVDAHETDRQGWDNWPVTGDPVRYVRFTGLYSSANQCAALSELEIYGSAPARRSSGQVKQTVAAASEPVSVLTSEGPEDETGWAAVDGDPETAWTGPQAGGGYLVVEYAPALTLRALEVDLAEGSPSKVEYLYSQDAEEWLPLPADLETNPVSLNFLWLVFPDDGTMAIPTVLEIRPNP